MYLFVVTQCFLIALLEAAVASDNYYRPCNGSQLKLAIPLAEKVSSIIRCASLCQNQCMGFRYIDQTCELDDRMLPVSSLEVVPFACYESESVQMTSFS